MSDQRRLAEALGFLDTLRCWLKTDNVHCWMCDASEGHEPGCRAADIDAMFKRECGVVAKILAVDIHSDRPLPHESRATMTGIANALHVLKRAFEMENLQIKAIHITGAIER